MEMRYIGPADQETIRTRFERDLQGDVRLVLFAHPPSGLYLPGRDEPPTGRQAQALMEELAALSEKLRLEVHNPRLELELAKQYGVERSPALVLEPVLDPKPEPGDGQAAGSSGSSGSSARGAAASQGRVRFFGLPSGYEFSTLLEDVVDVSRRQSRLGAETRRAVQGFVTPVHLQVFVTPT
jgi:hypothetical protein